MRRRAFTLVELSVSIAIGVALLAAVASAFLYLRSLIARNQAILGQHREAAAVQRVLADTLQMAHPGTQWRLEADPGAGGWDDRDETVSLTWMTAVGDTAQRTFTFGKDYSHDLVWARLSWRNADPAGSTVPSLRFACSDGFRESRLSYTVGGTATTRSLLVFPQPRRDRRRDLDDNDLRFVPGLDPAGYAAIGMIGDGTDLETQLQPLCAPATRVTGLAIGWYDRRGHWTGFDATAAAGIRELDAGGAVVPLLGQSWSQERSVVLDGLYLDGAADPGPAIDPVPAWQRRPVLVQIRFTLLDDPAPANAQMREQAVTRTFSFSFPVDPVSGAF